MRSAVAADGSAGTGEANILEAMFLKEVISVIEDFLIFTRRISDEDQFVVWVIELFQDGFSVFPDPTFH